MQEWAQLPVFHGVFGLCEDHDEDMVWVSVSSKTVEASSPDQFCCLIFLISCILKNLFDSLRLLEFRPQIAKKAMPPKLPQDIEKTPSCGSKRGMDAIDLEQNGEMKEVEVVEITNEVETAPRGQDRAGISLNWFVQMSMESGNSMLWCVLFGKYTFIIFITDAQSTFWMVKDSRYDRCVRLEILEDADIDVSSGCVELLVKLMSCGRQGQLRAVRLLRRACKTWM